MFRFVKNQVTGKVQCQFPAKLISIGSVVLNTNTSKQTPYRVCTIEFKDKDGNIQRTNGFMWESNYKHGVNIGGTYLSTATYDETRGVLITVSHLEGSGLRADADMFGFKNAAVEAPAKVESNITSGVTI